MKDDKKVPQLRFPEFTDAWKQRELGEIAERVTRRNSSLESQTPLTISAEYGLIDQNKFFGKRIAAKDLSNYYLIQKGEFAYNKSTSNDAPWGAIKRLDCYNNGALSTLYIVFKIKDNKSCYSDFLVTYYGTSLWHKGVKEIASEGARNHGLLNVSPSDFFRTKLVIPQDFEEQRKIGAFFTQLDNTITLQQRKLNSLQKLKKGLLQKMFPKKGENIPEIRFPEFSDAWKQRKLREVVKEFYNGKTPYRQNKAYWGGNVNWLTSGDLNRDVVTNTIEKITEEGQKASRLRIIPKGTLVIAIMGLEAASTRGNCGILGIDTTINQACMALIANASIATKDFLFQWYKAFGNRLALKFTQGTKQQNYNEELLGNLDISYPSLKEQQQIGAFFTQLDNTITLQQRKLESLQKLKKGLLQQMFI